MSEWAMPLPEVDRPRAESAPFGQRDEAWMAEVRAMHGIAAVEDAGAATVPDASDPEQIRAARRDQRLAERSVAATIHEMMQVSEVRAVIYRWLDACRAFSAHDFPYGAAIDPLQLARNAAHREVAQKITADLLGSAPEQYLLMLKEAQARE